MKLTPELQDALLELATAERVAATGVAPKESAEKKALATAIAERDRMRSALSAAQMAVDDMELEILRIQEDERKLRRRKDDSTQQLKATSDPELRKDLEKDRYSAKSRIADLMSELAEAHNEIHALRNNADLHRQRLAELETKVTAARNAVEALPEDTTDADRADRINQLRDALPADVIEEYEAQRAENEVGAAMFNGRSCGGCFIVLPPADISLIRRAPKDELPQCPDCGSYLIRKG
ncbi:C4-type zinc ribbon domain-containing protein [Corynebacterium felinum]|uniref:Nucleic acid-binding Zn-ribbon protein n=1 Tax=Corynebacterium felinum TaxID=131318 RepID=A0ABU2BD10_9CORY|nr:C4-type zinc ribbon domain-containing protein [Corynebacterium felinum]MDF5820045.1 C4-type zinc ribbon domain-containing protein [Corynebacterium felinum]MDR7356241.1 putative nucleic acid-binding Zn-ribbon protein [Corynebacterium felinum]WJY95573.1 Putative zinc ribbon domain protein [Corynebacterium felinum]